MHISPTTPIHFAGRKARVAGVVSIAAISLFTAMCHSNQPVLQTPADSGKSKAVATKKGVETPADQLKGYLTKKQFQEFKALCETEKLPLDTALVEAPHRGSKSIVFSLSSPTSPRTIRMLFATTGEAQIIVGDLTSKSFYTIDANGNVEKGK